MKPRLIHCKHPDARKLRRALYVAGTRYFLLWDSDDATFANKLAKQHDTGDSIEVSAVEFDALQEAATAA